MVRKANIVVFVACLLVIAALAACSITQLGPAATDAERRVALCKDAQFGYTLSVAMLDRQMTEAESNYWKAYKIGAQLALLEYCM